MILKVDGDAVRVDNSEDNPVLPAERLNVEYNGASADEETVKQWKEIFKSVWNLARWVDCYGYGDKEAWAAHIASLIVFCGVKPEDIYRKNKKRRLFYGYNCLTLKDAIGDKSIRKSLILELKDLSSLKGRQTIIADSEYGVAAEISIEI